MFRFLRNILSATPRINFSEDVKFLKYNLIGINEEGVKFVIKTYWKAFKFGGIESVCTITFLYTSPTCNQTIEITAKLDRKIYFDEHGRECLKFSAYVNGESKTFWLPLHKRCLVKIESYFSAVDIYNKANNGE